MAGSIFKDHIGPGLEGQRSPSPTVDKSADLLELHLLVCETGINASPPTQ